MSIIKVKIKELRNKDITKLNNILTLTITISAFFIAIDYFSAKPSISIRIHNVNADYNIESIRGFYKRYDIEIPDYLEKIFNDIQNDNDLDNGIALSASDISLIKILKNRNNKSDSSWITMRIDDLQHQINNYNHQRSIFQWSDSFAPKSQFLNILNYIKKNHSYQDYYT